MKTPEKAHTPDVDQDDKMAKKETDRAQAALDNVREGYDGLLPPIPSFKKKTFESPRDDHPRKDIDN